MSDVPKSDTVALFFDRVAAHLQQIEYREGDTLMLPAPAEWTIAQVADYATWAGPYFAPLGLNVRIVNSDAPLAILKKRDAA